MVESLDVTTAILSNTNGLHWETQRDHERIRSLFDRTYLSYQMGLAKPDRAIFEHVIGDLGVDPGQIVFCDDNAVNVEAARQLGIDAVLTVGVAAASAALRDRGLLG